VKIYTIGFAGKSAERFFGLLHGAGVQCLVDIRLHPGGQLSGFAKQDDLAYFLRALVGCAYRHMPLLAPSEEVLGDYRRDHDWPRYVARFEALMDTRDVPRTVDRALFEETVCCLLCSEDQPDQCHRSLVARRLQEHWPGTEIIHLGAAGAPRTTRSRKKAGAGTLSNPATAS
jgi:uncharacterized protein (DUF488 family)